MIAAFFIHSKKVNRLINNGVEVEGIVFDITLSSSIGDVDGEYPVIRFLTTDDLWITETYDIGTLRANFKRGQKVTVVYNPEDPKDFILKSDKGRSYVPVVILVSGVLVLIWGVYRVLQLFCNF
jgi:hypothetical protein